MRMEQVKSPCFRGIYGCVFCRCNELSSYCASCLKLLKRKERQVSAMQEDVLGTRRTAISETYVNCARCNKATRLRYARIIQSDVLSDSHSEFEYLCPECQKALADGEKDLPIV